jgi:hypothetical protein
MNGTAYVSAIRPEGYGDYDIYKITFNQIDPKYTVFKGFIQGIDSVNIKSEANITISNKKNNSLFGLYTVPQAKNGKYLFYLPPGKYEVNIEAADYKPFAEEIIVLDKKDFKDEINKNFIIKKPGDEKAAQAKANAKKPAPVKKKKE